MSSTMSVSSTAGFIGDSPRQLGAFAEDLAQAFNQFWLVSQQSPERVRFCPCLGTFRIGCAQFYLHLRTIGQVGVGF